jgi:hypothetical protein
MSRSRRSSLPQLLADPADRKRLLTLLDKLMADQRVQAAQPTERQQAMLGRIREVLARRRASGAAGRSRAPDGRAPPADGRRAGRYQVNGPENHHGKQARESTSA